MDRARKTYFGAVGCSTAMLVLGTAVFQRFPKAIIRIFGSKSARYWAFAVKSLKIFLLRIARNGFQLCTGSVGDACAFVLALPLGFLELRKTDSPPVHP